MAAATVGKVGPDFLFVNRRASVDATIHYLGIIHILLRDARVVVDVGCGRGAYAEKPELGRAFDLRGDGRKIVGADIDSAARGNPFIDEFVHIDEGEWRIPSDSADLVVSDWTLEHVGDPSHFVGQVTRILRPGGAFVARSVNSGSLLSQVSRRVPTSRHPAVISVIQPGRDEMDVFPTRYKVNDKRSIAYHFNGKYEYTVSWRPGLENYLRARMPRLARFAAWVEPRLPVWRQTSFIICARKL